MNERLAYITTEELIAELIERSKKSGNISVIKDISTSTLLKYYK